MDLKFPPLLEILVIDFKVLPGDVLDQSRNAHFASSQPPDKLVQPATCLTANKHGLAVFDSGDLQECAAVLFQRHSALLAADTACGAIGEHKLCGKLVHSKNF